jgi:hypothetical protein
MEADTASKQDKVLVDERVINAHDRKVIEACAKALNLELVWSSTECVSPRLASTLEPFNPLLYDADSRKVEVVMELNVFHTSGSVYALPSDGEGPEVSYQHGSCALQATRRAVAEVVLKMVDT